MYLPSVSQQSELAGYKGPQFRIPHVKSLMQSALVSQSPSLSLQGLALEQQVQKLLHTENDLMWLNLKSEFLGALCVFKCELSNLLFQVLYKSPSFGCCHLSHVVFLKLRKKELLAKLSKFTKRQPFLLKKTT